MAKTYRKRDPGGRNAFFRRMARDTSRRARNKRARWQRTGTTCQAREAGNMAGPQ